MLIDTPKTVRQLRDLLDTLIEGGTLTGDESVRMFHIVPDIYGLESEEEVTEFEVRIASNGGVYLIPPYLVDEAEDYIDPDYEDEEFVLMTPDEAVNYG